MSAERRTPRWMVRAAVLLGFVGVSAGARATRARFAWSPAGLLGKVRR